jgi:hypothetical protein
MLAGALPTDKQLWKGNSGLAYDFGICISNQDIISSRVHNHLCISRLNTCDWAISGVGAVCIVVGL